MRLQDTLTGSLSSCPTPPEPIGIYVCGPTVYARAHIGNARPFVVFTWLARWLRAGATRSRLVHNITDVNDKIYEAAPGTERRARASTRPRWYLEDTAALRSRDAGLPAARDGDDARDRRADRSAPRVGSRVCGRRRRLLPGLALGGLRSALWTATRPGRGTGAESTQGGSARLLALESDQGGRRHVLGDAVGCGPPGLAHRMLGHGREGARAGVLDPRWRTRSRLPPSRERARAVTGCRPSLRAHLDAQRDAALHRREDGQVGGQRGDDSGRARGVGSRDGARLLPDGPLAQADRLLARSR